MPVAFKVIVTLVREIISYWMKHWGCKNGKDMALSSMSFPTESQLVSKTGDSNINVIPVQ
jgi:hypothetical protein